MSIVITDNTHYENIAQAIREANGTANTYKPEEMAQAVKSQFEELKSIPIDNASNLFATAARLNLAQRMTFEGCTDFSKAFTTIGTTSATQHINSLPWIDTSDGTNFSEMYRNCSSVSAFPTIDTSNGKNFNSMYWYCTKMQEFPQLDVSNGTDFASMIRQCNALTMVSALNTVNGTNFDAMFYQSKAIVTIVKINVSNATKLGGMFYQCSALVTINFEGTIPISIDFSYCSNLSLESAKGILIALENYSGTDKEFKYQISFNATVWELLDADGETSPTGTTWKQYATDKGWLY